MNGTRLGHAVQMVLGVAAACVVSTLIAGASPAYAESNWAQVNGDGTIVKSRGITSLVRVGTGQYAIAFRRDVANVR